MKKLALMFILLFALGLSACSGGSAIKDNSGTAPAATANSSSDKTFTLDELMKYNGQNGNPAYVAVDGTVYDVTNASGWNNGVHRNGITAGNDLSDAIASAPHGKEVLKDLPIVGKLSKTK